MAVEATHLCLSPPTRVPMDGMITEPAGNGGGGGGNTSSMYYRPLSATPTTTTTDNTAITAPPLIPPPSMYAASTVAKPSFKSDNIVTYSIPVLGIKRPRDNCDIQPLMPSSSPSPFPFLQNSYYNVHGGSFTFLGQDISFEIQRQQLEIDRLIAQQTAKVRMDMEEKRKSFTARMIMAVEESVRKKLRSKDEEIEKMGRLNWALEEKVKSLSVENQIWRELAQSNEAAANVLRYNLQQVLLSQQQQQQQKEVSQQRNDEGLLEEGDAESCCGSNDECYNKGISGSGGGRWWCRNCGKEEARVLMLPCRHLCACVGCGDTISSCPVCLCNKNGTLHVNFSPTS